MNGGDRREEDWGFTPNLSRKPAGFRDRRRRVSLVRKRSEGGGPPQRYPSGQGRTGRQRVHEGEAGGRERSWVVAVVVLVAAAVVIAITGIALGQADTADSGEYIDWELLPLHQDTGTSTTG